MPGTLYYDVTDVLEYARANPTLSGIQRVWVQLLNRMVNAHGTERLRLIGWHSTAERLLAFDAAFFSGHYIYDQAAFCRHFGLEATAPSGNDLDSYLARKYGRSWRRPMHRARLLAINALTAGRTFQKRRIGPAPERHRNGQIDGCVSFSPGDVVFVAGATWNFDAYLGALARARRERGVAIVHYIHDLIPLLAPEHVVDDVPEQFARWLRHLSRSTDCFLTNSHATRRDLNAWLAERGRDVPSRVLPLAHQFGDSNRGPAAQAAQGASAGARIHARVLNAARLPYALCVGTIESRKNVWTLANVWQRIHARLGAATPRLIFAGKHGWLKEDFDDFIRGTGSLSGYIRIVDRPSDAELEHLYGRCLFSVFASYKEGWGLPVGEGLWLGRPVVCSGTSSMPEVGGALADYFDPTCWESIEAALLKMITDAAYRERRAAEIAAAPLRAWSDVADELWRELAAIGAARPGRVALADPAPSLRRQGTHCPRPGA